MFIIDSLCRVGAWKITRRARISRHDSTLGRRGGAEREHGTEILITLKRRGLILLWAGVYEVCRSFVVALTSIGPSVLTSGRPFDHM